MTRALRYMIIDGYSPQSRDKLEEAGKILADAGARDGSAKLASAAGKIANK